MPWPRRIGVSSYQSRVYALVIIEDIFVSSILNNEVVGRIRHLSQKTGLNAILS